MDDGFIAKQVTQGNTEAYRLLVLRYERPIFRFLHSFGFRDEQVAELAQEAFLKGFKKISSYDATKSSLATWLFTIAKNCALNEKKRHANIYEFGDQDIGEYATEQDTEIVAIAHRKQRLHQALAKLPEHFRNAITLSFLREL
jgi:RNA polymerase sigma-70 factor, ECF subfamily